MSENATAILSMEGVTKVYGTGDAATTALDNVDLHVQPGEVVVIMGPSGAGKTTFLTIAGALLKPTAGKVSISGQEITGMSEKELPDVRREKIGFIFQSFNLLESLTALENVMLVMTPDRARGKAGLNRAKELMSIMGLNHRLHSIPKNLSGGEKQRVAIARALANNPDLLLADEPTANLDSKRGREVMLLLRQIAREMHKSVVIVTHDHRIREVASRIVWLEDGTFRSDVETARDPVCSRVIEVAGAPQIEHIGVLFYFCGEQCHKLFQATPEKFAADPTATG
jgi:putative ABC transport system ATP-binding protein